MDMELSEWAALFCCDRGGRNVYFLAYNVKYGV